MKEGETLMLQIKVLDDGLIKARRKDRKPLTDEDREEARRLADSLAGISADDVLRIFPGTKVPAVDDPTLEGPTFTRNLKGGPCRVCDQPLPLDDEGFMNLWVHRCGKGGRWKR